MIDDTDIDDDMNDFVEHRRILSLIQLIFRSVFRNSFEQKFQQRKNSNSNR